MRQFSKTMGLLLTSLFLTAWLAPAGAEDGHGKPAAGHSGHQEAEKGVVLLSATALKMADLTVQPVGGGKLAKTLDGPGEVQLDEDRVAHLTPRVPGVVVKALRSVGDQVTEGEVLAILESADLGNSKIDFFTAKISLELARLDLEREQLVYDNTKKLLELLKAEPEGAEIARQSHGLVVGDNKTRLLSGYSAMRQAHAAWKRAQKLKQDKLVSEADYDLAAKEYESAQASYRGAFEDVDLGHKQRLIQVQRAVKLAETSCLNAERRLHVMGLTEAQVGALTKDEDTGIARYELRAPFAGTIIERHLTLGEHVSVETTCFVLADLTSVWCHVRVSPGDMGQVKVGQTVRVKEPTQSELRTGRITMVSPLVNEKTRAGFARVALANADAALRPGLFVTGSVVLEESQAPVVVPVGALQTFEGKEIVFVVGDEAGEFVPKPVQRGFSDGVLVEIKNGLTPGEKVVVRNSFVLKAELGKGAGGHEH
jgi:membrane fusion protein, heavy metal efflux system